MQLWSNRRGAFPQIVDTWNSGSNGTKHVVKSLILSIAATPSIQSVSALESNQGTNSIRLAIMRILPKLFNRPSRVARAIGIITGIKRQTTFHESLLIKVAGSGKDPKCQTFSNVTDFRFDLTLD
jgi:hypothetical protein